MEEIKKIPSRDQIPAEDKWAIEDLYATDDAWEADRATLEESRKTLASFAGRLGESGSTPRRSCWAITVCAGRMRTPGTPPTRG